MDPAAEDVGARVGRDVDGEGPGGRGKAHATAHDGGAVERACGLRRGPAAEGSRQRGWDVELRMGGAVGIEPGVVGVRLYQAGGEAVVSGGHTRRQQGRRVEALDRELDCGSARDRQRPRKEVVEPPVVTGWYSGWHVDRNRQRWRDRERLPRPDQWCNEGQTSNKSGPSTDAHRTPPGRPRGAPCSAQAGGRLHDGALPPIRAPTRLKR